MAYLVVAVDPIALRAVVVQNGLDAAGISTVDGSATCDAFCHETGSAGNEANIARRDGNMYARINNAMLERMYSCADRGTEIKPGVRVVGALRHKSALVDHDFHCLSSSHGNCRSMFSSPIIGIRLSFIKTAFGLSMVLASFISYFC